MFCRNCGAKIEADEIGQSTNVGSSAGGTKKNSSVLYALITAAVVVVVGAIILVPKFFAPEESRANAGELVEYYDEKTKIDAEPEYEPVQETSKAVDTNDTVWPEVSQAASDQSDNQGAEDNVQSEEERAKRSFYWAYVSDATWYEANQLALEKGGHLVYINDQEEFELVCQFADENNISVFWVGAKRNPSDSWSNTAWGDGEEITYINWFSGEPTYYAEDGESEDYLMVFKVSGVWYFNDSINDVAQYYTGKMGYIVEWEEFLP